MQPLEPRSQLLRPIAAASIGVDPKVFAHWPTRSFLQIDLYLLCSYLQSLAKLDRMQVRDDFASMEEKSI